jgi:hypothetical protein
MTPSEYISVFDVYASPRNISGLIYSPVPAIDFKDTVEPAAVFARPKSPERDRYKGDSADTRSR